MTKFAIFGDSYVAWLERFTAGKMAMSGLCRFFCRSGMSTTRKYTDKHRDLLNYRPDVVFLVLGGNDIRWDSNVDDIVKILTNIVNELYSAGVNKVYIGTIAARGSVPSFTSLNRAKFNKIRRGINRKLRKELGPD